MSKPLLMLIHDDDPRASAIALFLQQVFPGATVERFTLPPPALPDATQADAAIVRAVSNAGFRRVAALRRAHRELPIFVVGERDLSSAAYVAGANEYVIEYDRTKLEQAIRDAVPCVRVRERPAETTASDSPPANLPSAELAR